MPLFLSLMMVALATAPACGKQDSPEDTGNAQDLIIAAKGQSSFSVRLQQNLFSNATAFLGDIQKETGVELKTVSALSPAKEDSDEILIGNMTSYKNIIDAAKKDLRHGYIIKAVGQKILIVGTDDAWTVLGMEYFTGRIMASTIYCDNGTFKIPRDFSYVEDSDDPQLIARLLKQGRKFDLIPEWVGACPRRDALRVAQGAASDGKYVYFSMKGNEDSTTHDSEVVVFQYTLSPFKYVGESAMFNGHHANDMTYDTKGKRVLVNHGSGASSTLTAIPTEPTIGEPVLVKTAIGIGGITYNAKRDMYGITQGGSKYVTADASFRLKDNFGRTDNMKETYTAQGMGSDDSYVYFPMSPGSNSPEKVNLLVTYDWEGNYVGNLKIPKNTESESMFYAAGEYYVNFYESAAVLYRVYPDLAYQPQR